MKAGRALLGGLAGAQVAYGVLRERRTPGHTRALVGTMLITSLVEAVEARGWRRGAGSVAAAGVVGFGAELHGVATGKPFGHYSYTSQLGPRIGGVPVLAAGAWAMMARPSWVLAGHLTSRLPARIAAAAGALTAWDVFLDPRMAADGYWIWPDGGRYEGIPASNFLGWFATGLGVFAAWSAIDGNDAPTASDDDALLLYGWTWLGESFANLVLWKKPVVALAGGTAMGAFAAPALRARVKRHGGLPLVGIPLAGAPLAGPPLAQIRLAGRTAFSGLHRR